MNDFLGPAKATYLISVRFGCVGAKRPWNSAGAGSPHELHRKGRPDEIPPQEEIDRCLSCAYGAESCDRCDGKGNLRQSHKGRPRRNFELDGVTRTLAEWAEYANIPYTALYNRLENGWTLRRAVSTPLASYNQRRKA